MQGFGKEVEMAITVNLRIKNLEIHQKKYFGIIVNYAVNVSWHCDMVVKRSILDCIEGNIGPTKRETIAPLYPSLVCSHFECHNHFWHHTLGNILIKWNKFRKEQ